MWVSTWPRVQPGSSDGAATAASPSSAATVCEQAVGRAVDLGHEYERIKAHGSTLAARVPTGRAGAGIRFRPRRRAPTVSHRHADRGHEGEEVGSMPVPVDPASHGDLTALPPSPSRTLSQGLNDVRSRVPRLGRRLRGRVPHQLTARDRPPTGPRGAGRPRGLHRADAPTARCGPAWPARCWPRPRTTRSALPCAGRLGGGAGLAGRPAHRRGGAAAAHRGRAPHRRQGLHAARCWPPTSTRPPWSSRWTRSPTSAGSSGCSRWPGSPARARWSCSPRPTWPPTRTAVAGQVAEVAPGVAVLAVSAQRGVGPGAAAAAGGAGAHARAARPVRRRQVDAGQRAGRGDRDGARRRSAGWTARAGTPPRTGR